MNREYNSRVSTKNSKRLLKNLKKYDRRLFYAAPCIFSAHFGLVSEVSRDTSDLGLKCLGSNVPSKPWFYSYKCRSYKTEVCTN